MENRTLHFICQACQGALLRGAESLAIARVCTDSRRLAAGDLFVALAGENFDGHTFLDQAAARGAAGVVIDRAKTPSTLPGCAVIAVDDTRRALGRLAAAYRSGFELPVTAVAGSNGKTTTKDLAAAVLRKKFPTLSSPASFNNDIGVPLTLLDLGESHRAAVLEAGTNHPGELAPLLQMIRPRFGILTSIGREHLEFFRDLDGVLEEEGSLAEAIPPGGALFIPGDAPWTARVMQRSRSRVVRIGREPGNDWRISSIQLERQGTRFQVEAPSPGWSGEYRVQLLGRHQADNALLAIALGAEHGLSREEIAAGLAECPAPGMRLQLREVKGVRILDDSYNANADSMLAALETLQDLPCAGRRVAVLGDMAELGEQSRAAHEEVGRRAAELGVGQLFTIGSRAAWSAAAARAAGLNRVIEFADVDVAAPAVKKFLKTGDVVLLKASRAAHLERLSEFLRGGRPGRKN
ncbi:MAG: UDP-N-acetylmuramoyl-tripeptide--D-alanyl-D-alanine ligase [Verrucomicrobiota bacterium]